MLPAREPVPAGHKSASSFSTTIRQRLTSTSRYAPLSGRGLSSPCDNVGSSMRNFSQYDRGSDGFNVLLSRDAVEVADRAFALGVTASRSGSPELSSPRRSPRDARLEHTSVWRGTLLEELAERPLVARGRGGALCVQAVARESHWGSLASSWLAKNAFEAWRSSLVIGRPIEERRVVLDVGADQDQVALELQALRQSHGDLQDKQQTGHTNLRESIDELRLQASTEAGHRRAAEEGLMGSFRTELSTVAEQITEGFMSSLRAELSKATEQISEEIATVAGCFRELQQESRQHSEEVRSELTTLVGCSCELQQEARQQSHELRGELSKLAGCSRELQQENTQHTQELRSELSTLAGCSRELQQETRQQSCELSALASSFRELHQETRKQSQEVRLDLSTFAGSSRELHQELLTEIAALAGVARDEQVEKAMSAVTLLEERLAQRERDGALHAQVEKILDDLVAEFQCLNRNVLKDGALDKVVEELQGHSRTVVPMIDELRRRPVEPVLEELRSLGQKVMPMVEELRRRPVEPDLDPVLRAVSDLRAEQETVHRAVCSLRTEQEGVHRAVCGLRTEPDLSQVLSAISMSGSDIMGAVKTAKMDTNLVLERIERLKSDQLEAMAMLRKMRADLDVVPVLEAIERTKEPPNLEPILAAVRAVELDLSPVLTAIRKIRLEPTDLSPLYTALETTKNWIVSAVKAPCLDAIDSVAVRLERINITRDMSKALEPLAQGADLDRLHQAIERAQVDTSPVLASISANQEEVQASFRSLQEQLHRGLAKVDQSEVLKVACDLQMQMKMLMQQPQPTREVVVERHVREPTPQVQQMPLVQQVQQQQLPIAQYQLQPFFVAWCRVIGMPQELPMMCEQRAMSPLWCATQPVMSDQRAVSPSPAPPVVLGAQTVASEQRAMSPLPSSGVVLGTQAQPLFTRPQVLPVIPNAAPSTSQRFVSLPGSGIAAVPHARLPTLAEHVDMAAASPLGHHAGLASPQRTLSPMTPRYHSAEAIGIARTPRGDQRPVELVAAADHETDLLRRPVELRVAPQVEAEVAEASLETEGWSDADGTRRTLWGSFYKQMQP